MQRRLRNSAAFLFFITGIALIFPACQLTRFIFYNFADIKDHKKFPERKLPAADRPFVFEKAQNAKYPRKINYEKNPETSLEKFLEDNKTVAFLIIHKDSIQYENYFRGYDQDEIVPSFSMAKSVTSMLIGCAIDDGLIGSVEEPVTKYIPELSKNGFEKVTIKHLLQMTSGLNFNENYFNPFGHAAAFYYGRNLRKMSAKLTLNQEPGAGFDYVSGNTQLLGWVLERALKGKSVTAYFGEKIWEPLGMEYGGGWSLDKKKEGLEKTFCCLNMRARDFAKLGRLYLKKGKWGDKQLISEKWVRESTMLDTSEGSVWFYQYQWWIPSREGDFAAQGILGQFIYVNPAKDLIIVRLGKNTGDADWMSIFRSLAKNY
jgi:CubicO group peptidase (beta-lactamase class C family)